MSPLPGASSGLVGGSGGRVCPLPSTSSRRTTKIKIITLEQIKPFPKTKDRKIVSKRIRAGRTKTLTDTPTKKEMEEEHMRRNSETKSKMKMKEQKVEKASKPKKKISYSSDEEEDQDDWPCLVCCEKLQSGRRYDRKQIQCQECHKWAHVKCTDDDPRGFYICENCNSDDD